MRRALLAVWVFSLPPMVVAQSAPRLAEVGALDFRHVSGTREKRYIVETMGSGCALFDYDEDGDLDVYLVNASTLERLERGLPGESDRLFRNEGDFRFTDVTAAAGLGHRGFGQGVAVGDVDNDGDADLYVTNFGPNVLYLNRGDGTFLEAAAAGLADPRWSTSAAFADVDGDGFLDLYLCNYLDFDRALLDRLIPRQSCVWKGLPVNCGPRGFPFVSGALYHNRGDGSFEDWTERAGVGNRETYQLGAIFSDLDGDGDQDLYVATDSTPNLLFENLGDGRFADRSLRSGAALSQAGKEQAGMGVDAGDVNGDGRPDLFVTNFSDDYNTLYLNRGGLLFEDASDVAGLGTASLRYLGWSTRLSDLDADGDLDVFLVNGHVYPQVDGADVGESFAQPMQVFVNRGDGTFVDGTREAGEAISRPRVARGAAVGDLDGDRDPDVLASVMDAAPVLLRNDSGGEDHIVVVRAVGRKAPRDGFGLAITAEVSDRKVLHEVRGSSGYLSQSDGRAYIGLGPAEEISRLVVRWPGGKTDIVTGVRPGLLMVVEKEN